LDDIAVFRAGSQISADAVIIDGTVSVNESLLTGESDEITKKSGDKLMSGSFIVSGSCRARLEHVGTDSYISKLTIQAKKSRKGEQSEMIRSLNRIVKLVGIVIIPIGIILFCQQYILEHNDISSSIQSMVAAVIGMIPEGLFLLASTTLAVSTLRLATGKVLVHDMKCIETLARVDTLCVDKTGTITEGRMSVISFHNACDKPEDEIYHLISDFAAAQSADNAPMLAVKNYFSSPTGCKILSFTGFSSEFKYSSTSLESGNYVMGAPEFISCGNTGDFSELIEENSRRGQRVLLFGKYSGVPDGKKLTESVEPIAFIIIANPIRRNAPETFGFFAEQGVEIKVISGDNPLTVSEIARQAGVKNAEKYIDASSLKTDESIESAVMN
ncbi:MAG: HAD-IC family P-type ATPase, partial [Ruminococcus sp.]|nr:HAD-IC family P-type ATPase [Ruminococcus sp.]